MPGTLESSFEPEIEKQIEKLILRPMLYMAEQKKKLSSMTSQSHPSDYASTVHPCEETIIVCFRYFLCYCQPKTFIHVELCGFKSVLHLTEVQFHWVNMEISVAQDSSIWVCFQQYFSQS